MASTRTTEDAALAIVGVYPPPYSGVSVSLQRLLPHLDAAGIDYIVYNTGPAKTNHPRIQDVGWSLRWTFHALLHMRHRVIQFSTSRWWVRVFAAAINLLRGVQVIIYARGYSLPDSYFAAGRCKRWLVRRSLRRAACVLAPNPHLRERIAAMGYPLERIHLAPPFIPPAEALDEPLPNVVSGFCSTHSPVIAANGAYVLIDGQDVYGLRAMVDMVISLRRCFPRIGLVVYLREGAHRHADAFADLRAQVAASPAREHILFFASDGEFYPVLQTVDVFCRPTTTDGDANSIREALHFGVPVVTSNVIPRPEGCRLYHGGDQADLERHMTAVLEDLPAARRTARTAPGHNAAELLIPIYRALLNAAAPQPAKT